MSHLNLGKLLGVQSLDLTENRGRALVVNVGWSLPCLHMLR